MRNCVLHGWKFGSIFYFMYINGDSSMNVTEFVE